MQNFDRECMQGYEILAICNYFALVSTFIPFLLGKYGKTWSVCKEIWLLERFRRKHWLFFSVSLRWKTAKCSFFVVYFALLDFFCTSDKANFLYHLYSRNLADLGLTEAFVTGKVFSCEKLCPIVDHNAGFLVTYEEQVLIILHVTLLLPGFPEPLLWWIWLHSLIFTETW